MFALFLEFLSQQWWWGVIWAGLFALLFWYESRKSGKTVSPQELSNLVNRQEGVVVDIRDHAEYSRGHIPGALNIPTAELEKRHVELNNHKQKPVSVVCNLGQFAGAATKQLKAAGFSDVYKLGGGISEWTASQLPLVKKAK